MRSGKMFLLIGLLQIILVTGCPRQLYAANYYFSEQYGNDNRSALEAQHPSTPWKSLGKLAAVMNLLKPGDSILLRGGETFHGNINVSVSGTGNRPVVFGSYGNAMKPVISGLYAIRSWSTVGGAIREGDMPGTDEVNIVLINGHDVPIGRYPNSSASSKGYLLVQDHTALSITSAKDIGQNWAGGEVVIRKNRWTIDRDQIQSVSGSVISYFPDKSYAPQNKFGFFIQNHPATLDEFGEWYYDKAKKKLSVFFGNSDPSGIKVEAAQTDNLVRIAGQKYIIFDHIIFEGANKMCFLMANADHIQVKNCEIRYTGVNAVEAYRSDHLSLSGNLVYHSHNCAINFNNSVSHSLLDNNRIIATGTIPGMGKNGYGAYNAIEVSGNDFLIKDNQIDSTGYLPILFDGDSITIEGNHINHFCLVKDDGGGIKTGLTKPDRRSARRIVNNTVTDGEGAGEGTSRADYLPAEGIYMDDNTGNVEISGNTVSNCANSGLYLHNAHEINVSGNTFSNNRINLLMGHDSIAVNSEVINNVINGNHFNWGSKSQYMLELYTIGTTVTSFGAFDNNQYCMPVDHRNFLHVRIGRLYQLIDFAQWQQVFKKDVHSTYTTNCAAATN